MFTTAFSTDRLPLMMDIMSTQNSNWVKAEMLGKDLGLRVHFVINDRCSYETSSKEVRIQLEKLLSQDHLDCAVIFHEMGHAWQHQKFPPLMLLYFSYWGKLFLEWHASRLALKWMRKYFSEQQVKEAKNRLAEALNSYL